MTAQCNTVEQVRAWQRTLNDNDDVTIPPGGVKINNDDVEPLVQLPSGVLVKWYDMAGEWGDPTPDAQDCENQPAPRCPRCGWLDSDGVDGGEDWGEAEWCCFQCGAIYTVTARVLVTYSSKRDPESAP
ncbi:MAG: hypothetical protein GTN71_05750 [Anaerolineae bacterium]|nr:hypothetical protein [Anaerolineae bacterium]